MMFRVHRPQSLLRDMRINLGSRYICMTQHVLKGSQIGTACKEMRCKRMAQGMGADCFVNGHLLDVFFHDLPQCLSAKTAGGTVNEQSRGLATFGKPRAALPQVFPNSFCRYLSHWHKAFFPAFATYHDESG